MYEYAHVIRGFGEKDKSGTFLPSGVPLGHGGREKSSKPRLRVLKPSICSISQLKNSGKSLFEEGSPLIQDPRQLKN